jgi:hypothetical protein
MHEEEGKVFIANASLVALKKIQVVMESEAEKAGLKTEQDVADLVKSIRKELWCERKKRPKSLSPLGLGKI